MRNKRYFTSNVAYAKELGISEGSIRLAKKEGRVVVDEDGRIDRKNKTNVQYELTLSPRAGLPQVRNNSKITNEQQNELYRLKLEKEQATVQEKQLKNEIRRGSYISKEVASKIFNKIYAIHQSEFVLIPNRNMPELAAILGVDDPERIALARSKLEGDLWSVLGSIKRTLAEFIENEQQMKEKDDAEQEVN